MSEQQRKDYRATGLYAFVVAFVLTLSLVDARLAVVVAVMIAAAMVVGAVWLSIRDANRRPERIVVDEVSP